MPFSITQSLGTYSSLLTISTTGCLPSLILIIPLSLITGLTKLYSSLQTARDKIQSSSLNASAVLFNNGTSNLILFRISQNKLYSKSIIFSSAFKISDSFSFNSGEIYLSQLVSVCLRYQLNSSLT